MDLKQAISVIRKFGQPLLVAPKSNVRFVCVANKEEGPLSDADDFSVTAFVDQKLTEQELKSRGIPSFASAFSAIAGKKPGKRDVDIVETTGPIETLPGLSSSVAQRGRFGGSPPSLNAQKRFQSLRCGIGITNPTGQYPRGLSVGTAGFYMEDDAGNLYVVSNNHVIGKSNLAAVNESVVQPGTLDLTDTELSLMPDLPSLLDELEIAQLVGQVQLLFPTAAGTPNNRVDGAIAQLLASDRDLIDLDRLTYGGALQGVAAPFSRDSTTGRLRQSSRVYKVGRTTGYTEGDVVGIEGVSTVAYPTGVATFVDQIVVAPTADNEGPFSDRGDSGSGVLNDDHRLVGLLFAGNSRHTFVNPIREVIDELRSATRIDSLEVISG